MAKQEKLPIHVLSGFLGSGKTTLLQRWMRGQNREDVALLVNEFGEVGIDHFLLQEVAPDTILLPSGCVCCQIRGELKQALLKLYEQRERAEVPAFSKVILETTGLADPAPILSTLLHDRQLQYHFAQGTLVTLVDAEHAWDQARRQPEWLLQVAAADRLLISKGDRVTMDEIESLKDYLRQLNPLAQMMETGYAVDEPNQLFAAPLVRHDKKALYRWLGDTPPGFALTNTEGAITQNVVHPVTHTCVISLEENVNWPAFAVWLSMLLHRHGQSILRLKGILKVDENHTPIVIHGVQHSLHPPVHMNDWPGTLEMSQLVFIMRDIEPTQLKKSFLRFQHPFITRNATL
ncbi:GTP-binding protein [Prodigiosinella confusarubida]|uniref:GTP-binding protein n=1 Tax=Serratia sp. (strain ATCC 39006) TaxID=104623 RepID=A0A2I5TEM3_SERS3|nr:GTP-binding protein [Serratia sp. ATCC 39006]AUG98695.1 GTP-binding protein [Serratia sp. ATCC 39006]AUH03010.1 GTP-binding protein [Serratia sp. ATCC 39006]